MLLHVPGWIKTCLPIRRMLIESESTASVLQTPSVSGGPITATRTTNYNKLYTAACHTLASDRLRLGQPFVYYGQRFRQVNGFSKSDREIFELAWGAATATDLTNLFEGSNTPEIDAGK